MAGWTRADHSAGSDAPSPLSAKQMWRTQPVSMHATAMAVAAGPLPLLYIFPQASSVRIVDETLGQDIAQGAVDAQTLVRIDAKKGVLFGQRAIAGGPLPASHRYGIYLVPVNEGVWRSGVVATEPPVRRESPETGAAGDGR